MRPSKSIVLGSIAATLALLAALVPCRAQSGPSIDDGLVTAMDSIGRNLLGDGGFTARTVTIGELRGVQLEVSGAGPVAVWVNVFLPPDPCRPALRVVTDRSALSGLRIFFDPAVLAVPPSPIATGLSVSPNLCLSSPSPRLNPGLVQALDSVGRNLFGRDAFDTRTEEMSETSTLLFDLGTVTDVPLFLDLFTPPDPCRAALRIVAGAPNEGGTALFYDPEVIFTPPTVEPADLTDHPPDPCLSDTEVSK